MDTGMGSGRAARRGIQPTNTQTENSSLAHGYPAHCPATGAAPTARHPNAARVSAVASADQPDTNTPGPCTSAFGSGPRGRLSTGSPSGPRPSLDGTPRRWRPAAEEEGAEGLGAAHGAGCLAGWQHRPPGVQRRASGGRRANRRRTPSLQAQSCARAMAHDTNPRQKIRITSPARNTTQRRAHLRP